MVANVWVVVETGEFGEIDNNDIGNTDLIHR